MILYERNEETYKKQESHILILEFIIQVVGSYPL